MVDWTVFSNHGHVLVCLANNNEARLRDVAAKVGITERAVQKIVRELQQSGFIGISKHGRCNRYVVNFEKKLRHPLQSSCTVGGLLKAISGSASAGRGTRARKAAGEVEQPRELMEKPAAPAEVQVKAKSTGSSESKVQARVAPKVEFKVDPAVDPVVGPGDKSTAKPGIDAGTASKPAEGAAGKRGKKVDTRQQGSLF